MSMVDRLFRDHPAAVDETYLEHFVAASGYGARMLKAGLACLVHALVPGLCVHSAGDEIRALARDIEARRAPREPAIFARR